MTNELEVPRERTIGGVRVPTFLYGTAWKEDQTARCVRQALEAGFRAIDPANQRKHYHEAAVGQALAAAIDEGLVGREDVFLQTKFTHVAGQDHRLPFDPSAPIATQVQQSCASSLAHLQVEVLDALLLHGPSTREGLAPEDLAAWRAMEALQAAGKVRLLGISNVTRAQLELLCERAQAPIAFVQNRCYARTGWDRAVRALCRERDIGYQGFSLLTANRRELERPDLLEIAKRAGLTAAQAVFRFALQVGMLPLTRSTDPAHLREDLAASEQAFSDDELAQIEAISG